ncbi:daptide-type RiPP [Streptomyces sp. NPDC057424]|uniref:daptide-type RiPP n=1 Tax=Streptomyces sp. NPDC057424 TaxID=3346127 RepID=UPI0036B076AD
MHNELGKDAGLELALQELETLEAPGFWSGVSTGFAATAAVVSVAAASAATYTAISAITT